MTQAPSRFAVFGHPVAHSLSPRIHAHFARQTGVSISYEAVDAAPEELSSALATFAAAGGAGANITLPHKQAALSLCESLSERARRAGAANTLTRTATGWIGDNTDGDGLVRDLTDRNALDLRGRRTLLIGAGGAAHGVAPALLDAGIGDLFIINRHADRADALVDALGQPGRVHSRYWDDMATLGAFDFIINATSAGRESGTISLPFGIAGPRTLALDLSYGDAAIPFLAWARGAHCAEAIDGLGMLIEQAALSFESWHGVRPLTEAIYSELRSRAGTLNTGD
jgi:shikimate dehydrogenase